MGNLYGVIKTNLSIARNRNKRRRCDWPVDSVWQAATVSVHLLPLLNFTLMILKTPRSSVCLSGLLRCLVRERGSETLAKLQRPTKTKKFSCRTQATNCSGKPTQIFGSKKERKKIIIIIIYFKGKFFPEREITEPSFGLVFTIFKLLVFFLLFRLNTNIHRIINGCL